MDNIQLNIHGARRIKAEALGARLHLSARDGSEGRIGHVSIELGSAGLALRLAGAINLIQQDDVSPIYPAVSRLEDAA